MAGAPGAVLTAFTPTLVMLVAQEVSDFMACVVGSDLSACTPGTLVLLA